MANIFDIVEELRLIYQEVEELDGELTDELAERLEMNGVNMSNKIDGYIMFMKSVEAENKLIKDEITTFNDKIKTNEAKVVRLKETIAGIVRHVGTLKPNGCHAFKTLTRSLWTQNTVSVHLADNFDVSKFQKYTLSVNKVDIAEYNRINDLLKGDKLLNITTIKSPDKKAIKAELSKVDPAYDVESEDGVVMMEVEGAELVTTNGLRFR